MYILQSKKDNSLYVGSTIDLKRRVTEHNKGRVKSTKSKRPLKLVYYEAYLSEETARKREKSIKIHGNIKRQLKNRIENDISITN